MSEAAPPEETVRSRADTLQNSEVAAPLVSNAKGNHFFLFILAFNIYCEILDLCNCNVDTSPHVLLLKLCAIDYCGICAHNGP